MKKVIALSLALVLALSLATVAFAANPLWSATNSQAAPFNPGEKVELKYTDFTIPGTSTFSDAYFTSTYLAISKVKYKSGAALVESLKFDNDGNLVLKLKGNFELEAPSIPNFEIETLELKVIKESKTPVITKGDILTLTPAAAKFVGYATKEAFLSDKGIEIGTDSSTAASTSDINLNTDKGLFKFKKASNVASGEKAVDFKDINLRATDFYGEVRVFKDEKIFLEPTYAANVDVVKAYPDAELTFIGFKDGATFSSNVKVEFSAEKDQFIYEIKDGKVTATNLKWDDSAYAFTGKTRTLGKYVISDVELKAVVEDGGKNPNTGR